MRRIFSKFFTGFLYTLILLLLVFVINSIYCRLNHKVPSYLGYSVLRILTGSMEPEIKPGDYILVKKVAAKELSAEDIITFYSSDPALRGNANTHRIVSIDGDSITTKGDANAIEDKYKTSVKNVVGKYQGKLSVKILRELFLNKGYFLIFIILPICIIVVSELINIAKLKHKKKDDK